MKMGSVAGWWGNWSLEITKKHLRDRGVIMLAHMATSRKEY